MTPQPVIFAEPDEPFWGYGELFAAGGLFLVTMVVIIVSLRSAIGAGLFSGVWSVVAEAIAYLITFLGIKLLFARHDQPLLKSLGWVDSPFSAQWLALTGFGLSLAMVLLGAILQTPQVETPFEKLLADPLSRIVIAIFGVAFAPAIEELLFRGFLQPLLVRSFGVLPGILVSAALFGSLHLAQNASLWQSFVLITVVGFVLGTIRHVSGSTKASTIVHMAYNTLPLIGLLASGGPKHP